MELTDEPVVAGDLVGQAVVGTTAAGSDLRDDACGGDPAILEEIEVEELTVDGICGVY